MATQQSHKHRAFVSVVRNITALSTPNQMLLLFIPESTKETNPKYLSEILHIPAESSLSEMKTQQNMEQIPAEMDRSRVFTGKAGIL